MIIDRFEGELAILELEDGTFAEIPKTLLPDGAKQGDCIRMIIDKETTEMRQKRIRHKMDNLFQN